MFLIGLNWNAGTGGAHIAILEKRLKNLKRHYRLVETARWPADASEATILDALIRRCNDPCWTVRRTVFSQDRRPTKNVRTPPLIAARFRKTDTGRIDALRARKLPVEGIAVTEGSAWRREDYTPLRLGNNYFVPGSDLQTCLSEVCSRERLTVAPSCPMADPLAAVPPRFDPFFSFCPSNPPETGSNNEMWIAVALPIWFSETIRNIRRYGNA